MGDRARTQRRRPACLNRWNGTALGSVVPYDKRPAAGACASGAILAPVFTPRHRRNAALQAPVFQAPHGHKHGTFVVHKPHICYPLPTSSEALQAHVVSAEPAPGGAVTAAGRG